MAAGFSVFVSSCQEPAIFICNDYNTYYEIIFVCFQKVAQQQFSLFVMNIFILDNSTV